MMARIRRQDFYAGLRHAAKQVPMNVMLAGAVTGFATSAAESEVMDKPDVAAFCGIVTTGMIVGAFIGDVCNWTMNGRTIAQFSKYEPDAFSPQFLRPLTDAQETVHVGHAQGVLLGAFAGAIIALKLIALPAEARHHRMMEVIEQSGRQADLVLTQPLRRASFHLPKELSVP